MPGVYYYTEAGSAGVTPVQGETPDNPIERLELKTVEDVSPPEEPNPSRLPETTFELDTLAGAEAKRAKKQLRVEINDAPKDRLNSISGVGPATADAIIEYRNRNSITSISDLENIRGIGPSTAKKIASSILINGEMPEVNISSNGNDRYEGPTINLNTATKKNLTKLNGIGNSTAQKIIEYRNSNDKIEDYAQLTSISGIGESTVEKLRQHSTL